VNITVVKQGIISGILTDFIYYLYSQVALRKIVIIIELTGVFGLKRRASV
jgi:hypothetical protein